MHRKNNLKTQSTEMGFETRPLLLGSQSSRRGKTKFKRSDANCRGLFSNECLRSEERGVGRESRYAGGSRWSPSQ
jgi:hypothetical protein